METQPQTKSSTVSTEGHWLQLWKDTVLVAVLCVLLHPLQVLLVTFQTPGVVFELRHSVALFQAQVQDLGLLVLLHLIAVITANRRRSRRISLAIGGRRIANGSHRQLSPDDFVVFAAVPRPLLAVVVLLQQQPGLHLVAPLEHLALWFTV